MLHGSRERPKQRQSSQDSVARYVHDAALIGWVTEMGGGIVGENGNDDGTSGCDC